MIWLVICWKIVFINVSFIQKCGFIIINWIIDFIYVIFIFIIRNKFGFVFDYIEIFDIEFVIDFQSCFIIKNSGMDWFELIFVIIRKIRFIDSFVSIMVMVIFVGL